MARIIGYNVDVIISDVNLLQVKIKYWWGKTSIRNIMEKRINNGPYNGYGGPDYFLDFKTFKTKSEAEKFGKSLIGTKYKKYYGWFNKENN